MTENVEDGEQISLQQVEYLVMASTLFLFIFAAVMHLVFEETLIAGIMVLIGLIDYPAFKFIILPNLEAD